jgi:enoyl-[acyl-carrier-protein] reductase (NADH)
VELGAAGIRVNAICPGAIDTPLMHGGRPERASENVARIVPWPDAVGRPDDIAGAALFLAGDDSAYVTGEALVVDGGLTAASRSLWSSSGPGGAPLGFVGANRGSTGQGTVIRQRPTVQP